MALRYVSYLATGSGTGTLASPWTIAQGFANVSAGDTLVILSDGNYTVSAALALSVNNVRITGATSAGVVDGVTQAVIAMSGAPYLTKLIAAAGTTGTILDLLSLDNGAGGACIDGASRASRCKILTGGATNSSLLDRCLVNGTYLVARHVRCVVAYGGGLYSNGGVFRECLMIGGGVLTVSADTSTLIDGCSFIGSTVLLSGISTVPVVISNSVFADISGGYAVSGSGTNGPTVAVHNCASYNCTSGAIDPAIADVSNLVTLSGRPFVSPGSTINSLSDAWSAYALNNVPGAGAACRGAAYPAFGDLGAVQHQDSYLGSPRVDVRIGNEWLSPGGVVRATARVVGPLGNAVVPDTAPTWTLYRNGVADSGVTVVATSIGTGLYALAATLSGSYVAGNAVSLRVSATVGGVAVADLSDSAVVMPGPVTAIPAGVAGQAGGVPTSDAANGVNVTRFAGNAVQLDGNNLPSVNAQDLGGAAAVATDGKLWVLDGEGNDVAPASDTSGVSDTLGMIYGVVNGIASGSTAVNANLTSIGEAPLVVPSGSQSITFPAVIGTSTFTAGGNVTVNAYATGQDPAALLTGSAAYLSSVATTVEGHLLNDADGQALLAAIVAKINATDVNLAGLSVAAIASAVAGYTLASASTPGTLGYTIAQYVDAKISSRSTFAGGAVSSVTGAVGSVTSPVTVGTNNDKAGYSATATNLPIDYAKASDVSAVGSAVSSLGTSLASSLTTIAAAVGGVAAAVWQVAVRTVTGLPSPVPAGYGVAQSTGAYPVTVTVTDGTNPVHGATVRATINGQSAGVGTTGSAGTTSLSLDAGTYTVTATAPGFSGHTQTAAVAPGQQAVQVTLAAVAVPTPPGVGMVTGTITKTDGSRRPVAGAVFTFRLVCDPLGDNVSGSSDPFVSNPTDVDGFTYVQFAPGWTYEGRAGPLVVNATAGWTRFTAEMTNFEVPTLRGG